MVQIIFLLFAFSGIILMAINKGYKQILLILALLFFIPPGIVILGKPLNFIVIVFFFLSVVFQTSFWKAFAAFPLKKTFIFFSSCILCIGILDTRLSFLTKIARPSFLIIDSFLIMPLVFIALYTTNNYIKFYKGLFYIFSIFIIYGTYCYITNTNPYIAAISDAFHIRNIAQGYMDAEDDRFRISSFLFHPFLYSILLNIIVLLGIYFYKEKVEIGINRKNLLVFIILGYTNIFFTNSRTVIIIVLVSSIAIFLFKIKTIKLLSLIVLTPIIFLILLQLPEVSDIGQKFADSLSFSGDKVQGSNIDMRQTQFLISGKYFLDSPIHGNGIGFIEENLGFNTDIDKRTSDIEAAGFESYLFILFIEQGLLGIISTIILFTSLIRFHVINILHSNGLMQRFIFINLIIIVGYFIFIISTGAINSFPFFFSFMGISTSIQQKYIANLTNG